MKVLGKVVNINIPEFKVLIQCSGKIPKMGDTITLKWGKSRSIDQNSLYWKWLEYCYEHGMKDQGYLCSEEIHEDLKNRLLSKKIKGKSGFDTLKVKSTTELTSDEMVNYMERAEVLLSKYCGIDFGPFWSEYEMYRKGN